MYDLAIVGAGPAGATLARLLGRRYRVLLLERRNLMRPNGSTSAHKCCGGLLAPDAQKILGVMGLALPKDVLVEPQLFVVRTIDLESGQERYYQRFYLNMDREKFDRWLLSLVPDTVDIRCSAVVKEVRREGGLYRLQYLREGETREAYARCLVGADGAASLVRRRLFTGKTKQKLYAAIQEWFPADAALPYFSVFFARRLTDFYGWTIPKDGMLLLGAALAPGRNAVAAFAELKRKLAAYGYRFADCQRREGAYIVRPCHIPHSLTDGYGAALIGEAAGWISPSSAEGFSFAFRSALACANSLAGGLDGFTERYRRETGALRRQILLKNIKLPFMYHPLLRRLVMGLGLAAMNVKKN
ncbi:MAG: FAD-binding protein [Firmicutes bacterium]|nr:FAD-binding protein [Bacillota bacterium]